MYGKTGKSSHYLPRKGSYSTVPHRNGRVDVLPPSATIALYDIAPQIDLLLAQQAALDQQLELLRAELTADGKRFHAARLAAGPGKYMKRPQTLVDADAKYQKLKLNRSDIIERVRVLRGLISGQAREKREARGLRFERTFHDLAKCSLPEDVYQSLRDKTFHAMRDADSASEGS